MRASAIRREAVRNLRSGTSRAFLLAFMTSVLICAAVLTDGLSLQSAYARAEQFHQSGASITVLSAPNGIDGGACDALSNTPGIRQAGAIRTSPDPVVPAVLASEPIPSNEGSPGFMRLVGAPAKIGVSEGPEVAQALGPHTRKIATSGQQISIAGSYSYPDDGRRGGLRWALLAPAPTTAAFDECWVDVWPVSSRLSQLVFTALKAPTDSTSKPELSQLNTRLGGTFDLRAEVEQRGTRFNGALCAFLVLLVGVISVSLRRMELASALHAGVGEMHLIAILLIETTTWAVATLGPCALFVWWLASSGPAGSDVAVLQSCIATMTAGVPACLSGAIGALATIREDRLFAYFKNR